MKTDRKKALIIRADNNKIDITIRGHAPNGPGSIDYHGNKIRLILGQRGEVIRVEKLVI